MLGQRPRAERALVLGREVGLVGRGADQRERVGEVDDRDLVGHDRQPRARSARRPCRRARATAATMPASTSRSTAQHVAVVLDEAELDVERAVLREVAHRVVRLGAEHRADLVDPLEDPDQLLLVELRALREVGRAAEVVDLEDVGAGLGRRLDELRGRRPR